MPTVLRIGSFRFHFYSDERNEPSHTHVETPDRERKFWLEPVKLARNRNVKPHAVREIEKLVFNNILLLKKSYDTFHNH